METKNKQTQQTTFTPGPWFVNGPYDFENDLFIRATLDGENFDIASTYDDETGQAKANAQLIAAAPELLEALEKLGEACLHTNAYTALRNELFNAQQAINKARGAK